MEKRYNDSQVKAIGHFNGPCLTLAGPGSGKTAVITERTKNLITKYHVNPSNILVITFTKAAALEMKTRFLSLMGNGSYPVTFGTLSFIRNGMLYSSSFSISICGCVFVRKRMAKSSYLPPLSICACISQIILAISSLWLLNTAYSTGSPASWFA